ncbi:hypothetical protein BDQ17DRAFT_1251509, partial [Cyathus striatus]
AAHHFEVEKNLAQEEIRDLHRKLEDAANYDDDSDIEAPVRKRIHTAPSDSDEQDIRTQVVNAGRKYVILCGLWLRLGAGTFQVVYNPETTDYERFENAQNKIQGQIREIREILGPGLAADMSSDMCIANAFVKGMKSQCSNTSSRLRRQCAALFDIESESDLLDADLRREKFKERIGWVDSGHGRGSYSSVDVEILHKDYKGVFDYDTIFRNPILMWVFVAIIHGPTTAKEMKNKIPAAQKTDTMARKHSIRHTTPGAIAGAAVLARWTLSGDTFLQSKGTTTGIDYAKDFDEYLEILMKGVRMKKKGILDIFAEWDHVIFPNSESSFANQNHESSSSGLRKALEMLEADNTAEDELDEE